MSTDIKIICCDIDGTLVTDDKRLLDENKYWIKKVCDEKGVKFCFVSGRMYDAVQRYCTEIGIKGVLSCFNGCCIYDLEGNNIADHRHIKDHAIRIATAAKEIGFDTTYFDDKRWIMENRDCYGYRSRINFYTHDCEIAPSIIDLCKQKSPNKLLMMSDNKSCFEKMHSFLEREENRDLLKLNAFFGAVGDFVEITPYGFDKGTSVVEIAKYYNTDLSQVMVMGDDWNDLPMFDVAGVRVAMGNAIDSIKKKATFITSTNEECGVAKAIQEFFYR